MPVEVPIDPWIFFEDSTSALGIEIIYWIANSVGKDNYTFTQDRSGWCSLTFQNPADATYFILKFPKALYDYS